MAKKQPLPFQNRLIRLIFLVGLGLLLSLSISILPGINIPTFSQSLAAQLSAPALVQRGRDLYQAGQFREAAAVLQQASQLYQAEGKILNQALALNYLSLAYQKLGEWQQAEISIQQSLSLVQGKDGYLPLLAQLYNTQGQLQLALGQSENALISWQKAAENYKKINHETGFTGSLINQAQALESLGLYRRSCQTLLQAFNSRKLTCEKLNNEEFSQLLQTIQQYPNSLVKVIGLRSLGNVLRVIGNLEQSQQALQDSLAIAQPLNSSQEQSATLLSLGNTVRTLSYREKTQVDTSQEQIPLALYCQNQPINREAIKFYQQAVAQSLAPLTQIQAQLNLWEIQPNIDRGDLQSFTSQLNQLSPSQSAIYARIKFAQILTCFKQRYANISYSLTDEINQLNRAIQQARTIKSQRAESLALGTLGQLYEYHKNWLEAQQYTEAALNLAQLINANDLAYQWQWQLGRIIVNSKGDTQNARAIAAYSEAVNSLQALRSDLIAFNPDIQFDFRQQVEPVYRKLVELLLQPQLENAKIPQENLAKARQVIEALQLAELDNFFRDACADAQPELIDQLIDKNDSTSAVIYPIILPNQLSVILKIPQRKELQYYSIAKPQAEIKSILDQFRRQLEEPYTFQDVQQLGSQVYQWLIQPAEPYLTQAGVKTLVFVLDSSLRNIPMAALYDGKQYLIEKYALALTPGLQLLSPKPLQALQLKALTGGLTEARPPDFSALPNVDEEIKRIGTIVPNVKLLNQEFTKQNFENKIQSSPFSIIHLATHGRFSDKADETFILTYNDRINVNELDSLLRNKSQGKSEKIELLVLSACETATGNERAALGIAGVAVRAGARSTVASLWKAEDESTAFLMAEFYRQLKSNETGLTKAEALRRAQVSLLQERRKYRHPRYWSAFILLGNWL